jgi:hypothetical protein
MPQLLWHRTLVLKGLGVPGRGWPSSPLNVPTPGYPVTITTRRRHGEDGISFEHRGPCRDPHRHRNCPGLRRGEFTTGYTGDGTRNRRKVNGKTKAAVVDKLRDVHLHLDKGITPKAGYAPYTVRQAAEDWLASRLDGRSAKTVTKNQNVLEPILAVIGARKLRDLTANDLVSRNVAILADIPKGRKAGRPNRSPWTRPSRSSPPPRPVMELRPA